MCDFRWAKRMQFQSRVELFELPEQCRVKFQAQIGMVAALQEQLVASIPKSLFYFLFVGFDVRDVALIVPGTSEEVTEFAVGNTYIGCIDIAVNLPSDLTMWNLYLAQLIGNVGQICRCRMLIQKDTLFLR